MAGGRAIFYYQGGSGREMDFASLDHLSANHPRDEMMAVLAARFASNHYVVNRPAAEALVAPVLPHWRVFAAGKDKPEGGVSVFDKGTGAMLLGPNDPIVLPNVDGGKGVIAEIERWIWVNGFGQVIGYTYGDERTVTLEGGVLKDFQGCGHLCGEWHIPLMAKSASALSGSVTGNIIRGGVSLLPKESATVDLLTWGRSMNGVVQSVSAMPGGADGVRIIATGALINGKAFPLQRGDKVVASSSDGLRLEVSTP